MFNIPDLVLYRRIVLDTISSLNWSQLLDNTALTGSNRVFIDNFDPPAVIDSANSGILHPCAGTEGIPWPSGEGRVARSGRAKPEEAAHRNLDYISSYFRYEVVQRG